MCFHFCKSYGLNLSIFHPLSLPSSFVYLNRSCNLLSLPCQNSTIVGTTLNPPQNSGTGISSTPSNFSSACLTHSSNCALPSSSSSSSPFPSPSPSPLSVSAPTPHSADSPTPRLYSPWPSTQNTPDSHSSPTSPLPLQHGPASPPPATRTPDSPADLIPHLWLSYSCPNYYKPRTRGDPIL